MKKIFFLTFYFFAFVLPTKTQAQNLVPNYSFEDTIKCAPFYTYFNGYVQNWTGQGGGGGLCYFTSQCSSGGIPSNDGGHQNPHTGVSYAGIYTYLDTLYGSPTRYNFRNYIQDSLTNPLIGGTKYYVTFYVSLADTFKYACNNMGVYFSDSAIVFNNTSMGKVKSYLIPQVTNNIVHNPLTDKVNWMRISGSFVAAGGEQYIVIGNFVDDAHSDTIFVNSTAAAGYAEAAYYYIDDVIVSADSTYADSLFTGVNEIKPLKASVKVYPNPANSLLNVAINNQQIKSGTFCLYNITGQEIKRENLSENITSISTTNLPAGLYFYRITNSEGNLLKADKVVVMH